MTITSQQIQVQLMLNPPGIQPVDNIDNGSFIEFVPANDQMKSCSHAFSSIDLALHRLSRRYW
jgi:hypothetical protein